MWDIISRDYNRKLSPRACLRNVTKYLQGGSIVVFHDSLKSEPRLMDALPRSIEWLKGEGYEFRRLSRPDERL